MRKKIVAFRAIGGVAALVAAGTVYWSNNSSVPFAPTERNRALKIAHRTAKANTMLDQQPSWLNLGGWPSSVTKVTMIKTTPQQVAAYLDEEPTDTRPVLVVQLVGTFQTIHSVPAGYTGGPDHVITIVADPSDGHVTEEADNADTDADVMPGATVLYHR